MVGPGRKVWASVLILTIKSYMVADLVTVLTVPWIDLPTYAPSQVPETSKTRLPQHDNDKNDISNWLCCDEPALNASRGDNNPVTGNTAGQVALRSAVVYTDNIMTAHQRHQDPTSKEWPSEHDWLAADVNEVPSNAWPRPIHS